MDLVFLAKNTKLSRNFDGSDESSEESITSDDGDQAETVTTTSRIDDIDSLEKRGASKPNQANQMYAESLKHLMLQIIMCQ